jgi:hypothetical protein
MIDNKKGVNSRKSVSIVLIIALTTSICAIDYYENIAKQSAICNDMTTVAENDADAIVTNIVANELQSLSLNVGNECSPSQINVYGDVVTYENIGEYRGALSNMGREGMGSFSWNDGSEYYGEWHNDCMDGEGILNCSNGFRLEGTFSKNDFYEGEIFYSKSGNDYTYFVENNMIINEISIDYKNGSSYYGTYKKNALTGKGTMEYKNGDIYKGYFKNGKRSGQGYYKWDNGASYKGKWKKDKMSGQGTYKYQSGSKGKWIKGIFRNNKPNGECIYKAANGTKYRTKWSNGKCKKVTRY